MSNFLFSSALFVLFLIKIESQVKFTFHYLAVFANEAELLLLPMTSALLSNLHLTVQIQFK